MLLQPSAVNSNRAWNYTHKDDVVGNTELPGQRHEFKLGIISVQEDAATKKAPIFFVLETKKRKNEWCIDLVFERQYF